MSFLLMGPPSLSPPVSSKMSLTSAPVPMMYRHYGVKQGVHINGYSTLTLPLLHHQITPHKRYLSNALSRIKAGPQFTNEPVKNTKGWL